MEKTIQAHVAEWKKEKVKEVAKELPNWPTIAVIDMSGIPSKQLQTLRAKLKGKAKIIMTKKSLLIRALQQNPNHSKLIQYLSGMPALLVSNSNAFELFKILKENMSDAPAKPGQIAPQDIIVKAGPTPFSPGPILSELSAVGIKPTIEGGKVVIKEDCVVVKEGEEISKEVAGVLSRLGITPMKIGIHLIAALEKGIIYTRNVLDINEEEYIEKVKLAYQNAFKLAVAKEIPTAETIKYLIQKAHIDAKKLAEGCEIIIPETAPNLIRKAENQAHALQSVISKSEAKKEE